MNIKRNVLPFCLGFLLCIIILILIRLLYCEKTHIKSKQKVDEANSVQMKKIKKNGKDIYYARIGEFTFATSNLDFKDFYILKGTQKLITRIQIGKDGYSDIYFHNGREVFSGDCSWEVFSPIANVCYYDFDKDGNWDKKMDMRKGGIPIEYIFIKNQWHKMLYNTYIKIGEKKFKVEMDKKAKRYKVIEIGEEEFKTAINKLREKYIH